MLLLRTEKLPEGPDWLVELKLDGYRALAIKSAGKVYLRSRNGNDFNARYLGIVKALAQMPDDTVIDGEVVALDPNGRPSFNTVQNYGSAGAPLHFFLFDLLILKGRDVMGETLETRRGLLEKHVLPKLDDPIRYSAVLEGSLKDLSLRLRSERWSGGQQSSGRCHRAEKLKPVTSREDSRATCRNQVPFVICGDSAVPRRQVLK